ncbi:MAG: hypothetical protein V4722_08715 [Bacteroidota bacterium]
MKTLTKKVEKEVTPENIGGACFNGKGMTKIEAVEMQEWVKQDKATNKVKQKVLSR